MATQKLFLGHVKGDKGEPGDPGTNGITPSFTVTAETKESGEAEVVQEGQKESISLTFKIPKGDKGDPGKQGEPGKAPTWKKIDHTINVADWAGSASPYICTIEVTDLTATQIVIVHNAMNIDADQADAFANACITAQKQEAGKIYLQAVNKPSIPLPVVILVGGETEGQTE